MNEGRPYLQIWRGVWYLFAKLPLFPSYLSDINRTAYIAGWQAHHHHQPCFYIYNILYVVLARCPCIPWNIKMIEGRPYLQMWRGVWVSFCKIDIASFLSVRYRSDGLYCRMAGTRSSPTMLFIRVGIKNRVGDDGGPAILQCRSSDLYLTHRKENTAIYPHSSPHLQIRPSLVQPFLPQDFDVLCNARASC